MSPEFFELHEGLLRQGPGEPADVAWAVAAAGVAEDARVLDAGAGAGADVPALLAAVPRGHVTAVERHPPFVAAIDRAGYGPRLTARVADMVAVPGPFDFVWCAGAIYFLGVTEGLSAFRRMLAPGGAVAFSEPVWTVDEPSAAARGFWAEYPAMGTADSVAARVAAARYETVARRLLAPSAWAAYYEPMAERVAALRPGAGPALAAVLDAAEEEIATWRAHGGEYSYLLSVVRPR